VKEGEVAREVSVGVRRGVVEENEPDWSIVGASTLRNYECARKEKEEMIAEMRSQNKFSTNRVK
jgi:hypothetical protein